MLIGDVAARAGVTAKSLRFYERRGLLAPPPRTETGYRDYPEEAVARIRFVKDAQASGFTLDQIREILDFRDGGEAPCGHVVDLVEVRLADVERRLKELRAVRSQLRSIAARAATLEPEDCDGYCGLIPSR